jgi:hypothetical protein
MTRAQGTDGPDRHRPAPPAERPFHPYPVWTPRFWHGMPVSVWAGLVAEHRCRVSPSRIPLFLSISTATAFNSAAAALTTLVHGARLRRPPRTPPPVFIIGHWRGGTTLLHELLMLDRRFCCPNTYQCFAPAHFLLTERWMAPVVAWLSPSKRPMDDVAAGPDRPQEDEFALANLGAPSPYRRMAFPVTSPPTPVALDVDALTPHQRARWEEAMRAFLAALAVRDPRRAVLKSPPHTARTAVLARMFPGARFIHVVRDPFVVFPSTVRLWRSLHHTQGLQVDPGTALEDYVFNAFETMYRAFERDRGALPPGSLHELRYEDLVADPVGRLAEAYERLGLEDFAAVRPALEAEAERMRSYRTNTYRHDPRIVAAVARRWGDFIDRYGYRPPEA